MIDSHWDIKLESIAAHRWRCTVRCYNRILIDRNLYKHFEAALTGWAHFPNNYCAQFTMMKYANKMLKPEKKKKNIILLKWQAMTMVILGPDYYLAWHFFVRYIFFTLFLHCQEQREEECDIGTVSPWLARWGFRPSSHPKSHRREKQQQIFDKDLDLCNHTFHIHIFLFSVFFLFVFFFFSAKPNWQSNYHHHCMLGLAPLKMIVIGLKEICPLSSL